MVFIDDYAHHPVEIEALLRSVRDLFPAKKLTVIFQPHLYSRTRDFAKGFGQSLSIADEVLLLDIYPAREAPIEGVSSECIYDHLNLEAKDMVTKESLLSEIKVDKIELLATVGAGDIDTLVEPIKYKLLQQ